MPLRPPRACRIGNCPHPAVSRGRCALHSQADEQQRHRYGASVYNDKRWRGRWGLRQQVLHYKPFCELCGRLASVVDHIIPHRGDEQLAFNSANLRPLCSTCHGRVTAQATWSQPNSRGPTEDENFTRR